MKASKILPILLTCLSSVICNAQSDSTQSDSLYALPISRIHFSGSQGKWRTNGHIFYKDSIKTFETNYGAQHKDSNVYFIEKIWYHENGFTKRHLLLDYKKRRKAQIIDKEYDVHGNLVKKVMKKAKRKPEQKTYDELEWRDAYYKLSGKKFNVVLYELDFFYIELNFINDSICIHSSGSVGWGTIDDIVSYKISNSNITLNGLSNSNGSLKDQEFIIEYCSKKQYKKDKVLYYGSKNIFIETNPKGNRIMYLRKIN